jgi:hypothetical protein
VEFATPNCCWYLASPYETRIGITIFLFFFLSFTKKNMTTLVSLVLNNADRLPIVGSPINQATTWYRKRSHSQGADLVVETPPPPYEKEPVHSRLTQISDYVWKRASFSNSSSGSSSSSSLQEQDIIKEESLDKEKIKEGISLIQMATEMNITPNGKNQQCAIDLYMMGLDKILTSLPGNCLFLNRLNHLLMFIIYHS